MLKKRRTLEIDTGKITARGLSIKWVSKQDNKREYKQVYNEKIANKTI